MAIPTKHVLSRIRETCVLPLAAETQAFTTTITRVPKHKITNHSFYYEELHSQGGLLFGLLLLLKRKKLFFFFRSNNNPNNNPPWDSSFHRKSYSFAYLSRRTGVVALVKTTSLGHWQSSASPEQNRIFRMQKNVCDTHAGAPPTSSVGLDKSMHWSAR